MRVDDDALRRAMARALLGDKPAYRFLLDQCRSWLGAYYRRRVPPQMIDDLVQETLLSVHAKRQSFDTDRPFLPWLAAIARYRWVDALRRMRESDVLDPETVDTTASTEPIIARLSLDRLLACLPPAQANAIVLTRIEGRSVADAARISGQSESLIKVNVHRGLRKLASLVESD
ncbi:MAG TPA: sigma-70 family RNA polymerase sigma factor [Sphingomicrobium sp.]|nr:sigma-70 family RNA polymerase sigma factor [Sphingomicrobium sp.]